MRYGKDSVPVLRNANRLIRLVGDLLLLAGKGHEPYLDVRLKPYLD